MCFHFGEKKKCNNRSVGAPRALLPFKGSLQLKEILDSEIGKIM